MTDKEILEMLKDIVSEVDYDIFKELFEDDNEDAETTVENLMDIVRSYVQTNEEDI